MYLFTNSTKYRMWLKFFTVCQSFREIIYKSVTPVIDIFMTSQKLGLIPGLSRPGKCDF